MLREWERAALEARGIKPISFDDARREAMDGDIESHCGPESDGQSEEQEVCASRGYNK